MPTNDDSGDDAGALSIGFSRISKISGALGQVWGAVGTVQQLIGFFNGAKSDTQQVLDAIADLKKAVEDGFNSVNDTLVASALLNEWKDFAKDMKDGMDMVHGYLNAFSTLDAAGTIDPGGERISIVEWCEGTAGKQGVLLDIGSWMRNYPGWLTDSMDGSSSPIELWEKVCIACRTAKLDGYAGKQLHEMMFSFMQSIYVLVQTAAYVHASALKLYEASPAPDPKYVGLGDYLKLLGSTDLPSTSWASFETLFAKYGALPIIQDRGSCAAWSIDDPANFTAAVGQWGIDGSTGTELVCAFATAPAEAPGNSYITGLRLQCLAWDTAYWYLSADYAQIQDDGSLTHGQVDGLTYPMGPTILPGADSQFYCARVGDLVVAYGYPDTPPFPPDDNPYKTPVMVGAQMIQSNGQLVLAVKYHYLITDPDGWQEVTGLVNPDWCHVYKAPTASGIIGSCAIGRGIDNVDLGKATTQSLLPLTTASFMQFGDRLGLTVRTDWLGYRNPGYQPVFLAR